MAGFELAGFSVVDLAALNPGTILVYIVAMYIGVYPVAISMRNSNVYQVNKLKVSALGKVLIEPS
jgi:Trk-type K+ transport system membrane component